MIENDPKTFAEGREKAGEAKEGSRREDTNLGSGDALSKFGKDKRKRITRVEKAPGRNESRGDSPYSGERRSFNPNFTQDNKLRDSSGNNRREGGYGGSSRDDYGNRKPYGDRKPYGGGGGSYNRDSSSYNRDDRQPRTGGYNSDRNREGGYNKPRPYGPGDKPRSYGNNDNPRYGSGGYNNDRNREGGYNKPRPYGTGDKPRSYGNNDNPRYGGDQRQGGNRYQGAGSRQSGPGRGPGQGNRYGSQGGNKPRYGNNNAGRYEAPRYDSENYPKYPREKQENEVRLNRYLSMSGICSRREADELILSGQVTVNGIVVTEMGSKVQPGDEVRYDGAKVQGENKVYIVMNKPKGYVTSLDDPHAEKTVMDILNKAVKERVYPVGRLDKNSMGVLLITNDGDMTKKLTHPSYEKKKIYQVTLDKALSPADRDAIAKGIELEDGFIRADNIDYVKDDPREIGIEIHSGRNRIVRRIFEHFGYQVHKLDRVYFAGLTKKNLRRGAWRFLSPREVSALHSGQYE